MDTTALVLFLVLVGLPIALGVACWTSCGGKNRDPGTRCRNPRRGPFRRCGSHEGQVIVRGDLIGGLLAALAAPGGYLWGQLHTDMTDSIGDRVRSVVDEFRPSVEGKPATVERVVNGDELVVTVNGSRERVRVLGIAAPSAGNSRPSECWGQRSLAAAHQRLSSEEVGLSYDSNSGNRDAAGRLRAYVSVDGDDFAVLMLSEGLARAERGTYERRSDYRDTATQARQDQQGLWGACVG